MIQIFRSNSQGFRLSSVAHGGAKLNGMGIFYLIFLRSAGQSECQVTSFCPPFSRFNKIELLFYSLPRRPTGYG